VQLSSVQVQHDAALSGGLAGGLENFMTRKRNASRLHLLTVREVQTAADGDHSDGGGLLLRVRGTSASWVLRYTAADSRRREMGLGVAQRANASQTGATLTGARDAAHKARELLRQGVDPIDDRAISKSGAKQAVQVAKAKAKVEALTLARAARDYHESVIEPSRTAKHSGQWIASLEHHVPEHLWHAPIASITAPQLLNALLDVRALADAEVRVPETLSRVRQRLDAVFEDAIFHGACSINPAAAIRRKMREAGGKRERGEFAALPFREAPTFLADLGQQQGTAARCLEFSLLTAARTNESLYAEWSEFDLDAGVWTIPAARMKAGETHTVYLSDRALDILREQVGQHASIVFPSVIKANSPQSNMAMLAVLDRMGARDRTTVHGLCRATFSTWANETGAARPDVVEACLAHRETDRVKAAYNRAKFNDERKALMTAWAGYLAQPIASNVVGIAKRA